MKSYLKSKMKNVKWVFVILAMFSVIVYKLDFHYLKVYAQERYTELQLFAKVLNLVEQYYVENVETKKLINGSIRGMLKELDPHSSYLSPEVFKDFQTETSGEFGGLGIEISIVNGILTIISPIEDTPAWESGLKPGDKVIAINGKSTKNLSLVECSQLLKGKKGVAVVLTIVRDDTESPKDIRIVRGSVKIKSIKWTSLLDGYHYIRITSFIENSFSDLKKIMDEISKNPNVIKGIIFDLRRNPGGLFDQAIKISDLFLKNGVIVSTIGRDPSKKEEIVATKKGPFTEFPIIILLNEYSASASEIFAGALKDNKRAIIMGQKSFGKGSVQSIIKLGDGSGLKLTVARYYTPNGKSIQAEGITPDIEVDEIDPEILNKASIRSKSVREKDMEGHLLGEKEQLKNKESESKGNTNPAASEEVQAWWKEVQTKKNEKMTPKEKLLNSDFQIYQAYNYIRAWKIMKEIK